MSGPRPAHFPDFWPEWWVLDENHLYSDGSKRYENQAKARVAVYPAPDTGIRSLKPGQLIALQISVTETEWDETMNQFVSIEEIPSSQIITANGLPLDCNGIVWFEITNTVEVTPVAPVSNYWFSITPIAPAQVIRSKAHHPLMQSPPSAATIQDAFNSASLSLLVEDDDGCIPDGDPILDFYYIYHGDDIPIFSEFFVYPASPETFPSTLGSTNYLNIVDEALISDLLQDLTSDIKIVESLPDPILGMASPTYRTMVIRQTNAPGVLLHEWGHTEGLGHRGDMNNPTASLAEDQNAIMHYSNRANVDEANRHEKTYLY